MEVTEKMQNLANLSAYHNKFGKVCLDINEKYIQILKDNKMKKDSRQEKISSKERIVKQASMTL